MFLSIIIVLVTFFIMEVVAWATHKYLMHGALWFLHIDHHQPEPHYRFQRNDAFFLIFAVPALILLYLGRENWMTDIRFAIGTGITLYGIAYFLVHDVLIHGRFRWFKNIQHPYFKAIREAHHAHHRHRGKEDGECFGMLWAPLKYFTKKKKQVS